MNALQEVKFSADLLKDPEFFRCAHFHATMTKGVCVRRQDMVNDVSKPTGSNGSLRLTTDLRLSFEHCANCEQGQQIRREFFKKEEISMTSPAALYEAPSPDKAEELKQRYCKKCDTLKPLDAFCRDNSTKDGYSRYCKECRALMQKQWRSAKKTTRQPTNATRPRNAKKPTPKTEDTTSMLAISPQTPPKTGGKIVLHRVMVDLVARAELGKRKYGTLLQTHNDRDPLLDAYQEALDLAMYLGQAVMEREVTP